MILCIDSFLKDRQVYLASILAYVTTLISSLQYPVFKVLRAGFLRPVASATRESRKAVLSSRVGGASRSILRKFGRMVEFFFELIKPQEKREFIRAKTTAYRCTKPSQ